MEKIDYRKRDDSLIKTLVMLGDLLLCNVLFGIACRISGLHEDAASLQSHLLITAVYFGCTVNEGIILHFKKVRNYQIVGRVLRNVFFFTVVATAMLHWGKFTFPEWSIYAAYLVAMLVVISGFRLGIRKFIKCYWQKNQRKNGVVFVGSTENNVTLYHELVDDPSIGYTVTSTHSLTKTFRRNVPISAQQLTLSLTCKRMKRRCATCTAACPPGKRTRYCPSSRIARTTW